MAPSASHPTSQKHSWIELNLVPIIAVAAGLVALVAFATGSPTGAIVVALVLLLVLVLVLYFGNPPWRQRDKRRVLSFLALTLYLCFTVALFLEGISGLKAPSEALRDTCRDNLAVHDAWVAFLTSSGEVAGAPQFSGPLWGHVLDSTGRLDVDGLRTGDADVARDTTAINSEYGGMTNETLPNRSGSNHFLNAAKSEGALDKMCNDRGLAHFAIEKTTYVGDQALCRQTADFVAWVAARPPFNLQSGTDRWDERLRASALLVAADTYEGGVPVTRVQAAVDMFSGSFIASVTSGDPSSASKVLHEQTAPACRQAGFPI